MQNNPKYILIHCTDYPRNMMANQFVACNNWHKDRSFPISSKGLYIGYHVLITGDSSYICRDDLEEGAHCNQNVNGLSMNFQSLSVCVGFDGDIEYLTAMEQALLQKQIWAWQDMYKIPNKNVKFHRFYTPAKSCPGSLITENWLEDLLDRPAQTSIPNLKPVEKMCITEEKIIAEQKAKLTWYEEIFRYIAEKWS